MHTSTRVRGAAAVVTALLAGCVGAQPASAASDDIPVAGTFAYNSHNDPSAAVIHAAINAVVRVPGGTAVYYSVGGPGVGSGGVMPTVGLNTPYRVGSAWSVSVVDTRGLKLYLPLVAGDSKCMCSMESDLGNGQSAKTPGVGYAVLPPLPSNLKSVTVQFGFGNLVVNVPVTDSLPTPTATKSPVLLGNGWPKLPDPATLRKADPKKSIRSLASNVADPETSTKRTANETAISVDTDVLFAYGKATLSSKANGALKKVAAQLAARGKGQVSIVGYTDSSGSSSFNQDLSDRRARAVQAALKKLVHKGGLTYTASGRGESDPVADNGTAQGRQLNRRVTVTFHTGAAK